MRNPSGVLYYHISYPKILNPLYKDRGNAIGKHIKTVAENSWVAKYYNDTFFDVASINSDTLWSFACQ